MSLTRLQTAKKAGFQKKVLRKRKEHAKQTAAYMKQKSTFFVAVLSLVAFVTGNMVGEHGWYAFWKAALGQYDDTLITYTGTVPPIAYVPDYTKWSTYGGNATENTYRQVPQDALIPLPKYDSSYEKSKAGNDNAHIYSVAYMGDYDSGKEGAGSHPGVDIRVPQGTPVRSIANGVVESVKNDAYGFGLYIVIRHPHMPDPENKDYETVLHSVYAHLSAQLVSVGDVVQKGQQIGLSGKTGDATGPHLHFQIDRDSAPWHPFWPFTGEELRQANLNTLAAINNGFEQSKAYDNTVNPVMYAQADYTAAKYKQAAPTTVATSTRVKTNTTKTTTSSNVASKTLTQLVAERAAKRAAAAKATIVATATHTAAPSVPVKETVVSTTTPVAPVEAPVVIEPEETKGTISTINIEAPTRFVPREWQNIRLSLADANGQRLSGDSLSQKIYMRTAYGEAQFDPPILSGKDFKNGIATVRMLARGKRTVVILLEPLKIMSQPIQYGGN